MRAWLFGTLSESPAHAPAAPVKRTAIARAASPAEWLGHAVHCSVASASFCAFMLSSLARLISESARSSSWRCRLLVIVRALRASSTLAATSELRGERSSCSARAALGRPVAAGASRANRSAWRIGRLAGSAGLLDNDPREPQREPKLERVRVERSDENETARLVQG